MHYMPIAYIVNDDDRKSLSKTNNTIKIRFEIFLPFFCLTSTSRQPFTVAHTLFIISTGDWR